MFSVGGGEDQLNILNFKINHQLIFTTLQKQLCCGRIQLFIYTISKPKSVTDNTMKTLA